MIGRSLTVLLVLLLLGLAAWQLGRAGLMAGKTWTAPVLVSLVWGGSGLAWTPDYQLRR